MTRQVLKDNSVVEVRSLDEILATLDGAGKLDGLPFMPEMAAYCGTQVRLLRRLNRTCVVGQGFRRIDHAVFLQDARCDGSHHDGCQRACMLFWKEAWLKPIASGTPHPMPLPASSAGIAALATLPTRRADRYICQSTELAGATKALSKWNLMPFLRDIARRRLSLGSFFTMVARVAWHRLTRRPYARSLAGVQRKVSKGSLDLQPGEWVDVKPAARLMEQLDSTGSNCGLVFQPTMDVAIGRRFQVAFQVQKIIIEETGKMQRLSHTVALKNVHCAGVCVAHCPRRDFLYWRESWLERAPSAEPVDTRGDEPAP